jgi:flavodoxin
MRTLVAYFSRTGHTQTLAQQIALGCTADLERIQDPSEGTGARHYLRSLWQAVMHHGVPIASTRYNPADYDLVVIGTPIWAWNISSPVRSYIVQHQGQFRRLALFCTCDGAGQTKVLSDLEALCNKAPIATLAVTTQEMTDGQQDQRMTRFLAQLTASNSTDAPIPLRPHPAL